MPKRKAAAKPKTSAKGKKEAAKKTSAARKSTSTTPTKSKSPKVSPGKKSAAKKTSAPRRSNANKKLLTHLNKLKKEKEVEYDKEIRKYKDQAAKEKDRELAGVVLSSLGARHYEKLTTDKLIKLMDYKLADHYITSTSHKKVYKKDQKKAEEYFSASFRKERPCKADVKVHPEGYSQETLKSLARIRGVASVKDLDRDQLCNALEKSAPYSKPSSKKGKKAAAKKTSPKKAAATKRGRKPSAPKEESGSVSRSRSRSGTRSKSESKSGSASRSKSRSVSASASRSRSRTASASRSRSRTASASGSKSSSKSQSLSRTSPKKKAAAKKAAAKKAAAKTSPKKAAATKKGRTEELIPEIVASTKGLALLGLALDATKLTTRLSSYTQPYTIFAPTDDAFLENWSHSDLKATLKTKKGVEKVKAILLNHIVKGEIHVSDLKKKSQTYETLGDEEIEIEKVGKDLIVRSNGAAKIITSIERSDNAVVHIIDSVLMSSEEEEEIKEEKSASKSKKSKPAATGKVKKFVSTKLKQAK